MDELSQNILKAQKGDKAAFGAIYELFYERIYRYCYFNTRKRELALDICQETFVRAWQGLPKFAMYKGGSLQAFLFRIARNLIIDNHRKKKEVSIEGYQNLESNDDSEDEIDKRADQKKLKQAIDLLSEKDKQIIVLKYFEDLSGVEIAKILKMREGALRVRTHRIVKNLKIIMEKI